MSQEKTFYHCAGNTISSTIMITPQDQELRVAFGSSLE